MQQGRIYSFVLMSKKPLCLCVSVFILSRKKFSFRGTLCPEIALCLQKMLYLCNVVKLKTQNTKSLTT